MNVHCNTYFIPERSYMWYHWLVIYYIQCLDNEFEIMEIISNSMFCAHLGVPKTPYILFY